VGGEREGEKEREREKLTRAKDDRKPGTVAHACNPSYSRGAFLGGWERSPQVLYPQIDVKKSLLLREVTLWKWSTDWCQEKSPP
jgi:hypothetical protein